MIKISDKSKKILEKYNIDYKKYEKLEPTDDNINSFLSILNEEIIKYRDKNDEPLKEWLEIEKVYDEIFYNN